MEQIVSGAPLDFKMMANFVGKEEHEMPQLLIDVESSKYKGKSLLMYLSNLTIPSAFNDISSLDKEYKFEVLKEFLQIDKVCEFSDLTIEAAQMLLMTRSIMEPLSTEPFLTEEERLEFMSENMDIIAKWSLFMTSLVVFSLEIRANAKGCTHIGEFPRIDDADYVGKSIVTLFQIPSFFEKFFSVKVEKHEMVFFTRQFSDYMFTTKKNLFGYFGFKENILLGSVLKEAGEFKGEEANDDFVHPKHETR